MTGSTARSPMLVCDCKLTQVNPRKGLSDYTGPPGDCGRGARGRYTTATDAISGNLFAIFISKTSFSKGLSID